MYYEKLALSAYDIKRYRRDLEVSGFDIHITLYRHCSTTTTFSCVCNIAENRVKPVSFDVNIMKT